MRLTRGRGSKRHGNSHPISEPSRRLLMMREVTRLPASFFVSILAMLLTSCGNHEVQLAPSASAAVITGLRAPMHLAVNDFAVFWTEEGSVRRIGRNGGSVTTMASGLCAPFSIALDPAAVYFT